MNRMRLVLFSMALLVTLFGLTAIVAYAQVTTHAQAVQNSHVQVTCSGNGCNGLDPQTAGCAATAYTVLTAVFSDAFVQLRYSRACQDRKSTRLNSSHSPISYAVFCLKKK